MIDSFVLLTPILLLGVMALVGFVGCDWFFGLKEVTPPPPPPTNFTATPGNGEVVLEWAWDPYESSDDKDANEFHLYRGESSGTVKTDYIPIDIVLPNGIPHHDTDVVNGTEYFYRVTAVSDDGESQLSDEQSAIPVSPLVSFVVGKSPMGLRTDFSDWAGMAIQVGPNPLTVHTLGRIAISANNGIHDLMLVNAATNQSLGLATVDTAAGVPGEFVYGQLPNPVPLTPGAVYYIVSHEQIAVEFYDVNGTTVQTTNVASVTSGVYGDGVSSYTLGGAAAHTFGPVDFQYVPS